VEQEVGGSSPPNCTSKNNHLAKIFRAKSSQKIELGRSWEVTRCRGRKTWSRNRRIQFQPSFAKHSGGCDRPLWRLVSRAARTRGQLGSEARCDQYGLPGREQIREPDACWPLGHSGEGDARWRRPTKRSVIPERRSTSRSPDQRTERAFRSALDPAVTLASPLVSAAGAGRHVPVTPRQRMGRVRRSHK
jgi:hypothetical protein